MNDELQIPLLKDLVSSGQSDIRTEPHLLDSNENSSVEIEQEIDQVIEQEPLTEAPTQDYQPPRQADEISDDASVRELIIDEEIRMILDKHMDKAYEEIIRLLNNRIA